MASQNLVSAVVTPERKTKVLGLVDEIGKELDFLTSIKKSGIQALVKAGNEHPDIMPRLFDLEEFRNDYLLAASSDAMVEALEVYAAVKACVDRVPGLQAAASEMAQFFKKTKAKTAPVA